MSEAYKEAGVNIDAGNEVVRRIKQHIARTHRPEVIGEFGGFGGLFALNSVYDEPVLVASTDGVGTKLKIAFALNRHNTIGIDCVAMCVNDVVVQGAEPLFFLDYLATGTLSPIQAEEVIQGIAEGCVQAGCALIGGETAEMPGMYASNEYDVAGFCVGIVEKKKLITGKNIAKGDVLIGFASSGLHSNGYSLVRKVLLEDKKWSLDQKVEGSNQTLGEILLTPTRIYVKTFLKLMKKVLVKGGAHITGGGLIENVPRMLPPGKRAVIDPSAWSIPPIFHLLKEEGNLSSQDLYRTFNMGIGMVVVVSPKEVDIAMEIAKECGEVATVIGQVIEGESGVEWVGGLT